MQRILGKLAFASLTFIFTAFVFVNTYEVVFNRDVAFAQSIKQMATQETINQAVADFATKISSENELGTAPIENIDSLEIPALTMQLKIEESRKVEGRWYQRPSAAHYIGLNRDQAGTTVDYLIYTSKSWRSIPGPAQIEQGMEVQLYYNGGAMSLFEVAEKKVLPLDSSLLVSKSEDRQILLLVEDPKNNLFYGYSLVLKR